MSLELFLLVGFLFGMGFGFFVQRSGLCFAVGLGELFSGRWKRIVRFFLIIFIITNIGFLLSGVFFGDLGLKPIGLLRGYGLYNILSGMFFGAGILLNGGCILGTLRQIGEGDLTFVIVLLSFIPGMALIIYFVNPLLESTYIPQKILMGELLGVPEYVISMILAPLSLIALVFISRKGRKSKK